jgi:predicted flap endonuclease-1-like 5' DNA nuclease
MPGLSPAALLLCLAALFAGLAIGWLLRGRRSDAEKSAINSGWQTELEARTTEHQRLADQNTRLMEQVNQLQLSSRQAAARSQEQATALAAAEENRDELAREIRSIRSNLENLVSEKHRLSNDLSARRATEATAEAELSKKDQRIDKLSGELRKWQDRLPPLVDRFREKAADVDRLEAELDAARGRIAELELGVDMAETRVGLMMADELLDDTNASNEALGNTPAGDEPYDAAPVDTPAATEAPLDADEADAINGKHAFGGLRDDLKAIKGIGPAIEKTLNELGIFRYAQVADMSRYDIERIGNRLKGFKGRIEREDWMGQARALAQEKIAATER